MPILSLKLYIMSKFLLRNTLPTSPSISEAIFLNYHYFSKLWLIPLIILDWYILLSLLLELSFFNFWLWYDEEKIFPSWFLSGFRISLGKFWRNARSIPNHFSKHSSLLFPSIPNLLPIFKIIVELKPFCENWWKLSVNFKCFI